MRCACTRTESPLQLLCKLAGGDDIDVVGKVRLGWYRCIGSPATATQSTPTNTNTLYVAEIVLRGSNELSSMSS